METTLVESVDDAIVELCSRRKRYPQKLTINCRKLLEAQTVNCVSMQKGGGGDKMSPMYWCAIRIFSSLINIQFK